MISPKAGSRLLNVGKFQSFDPRLVLMMLKKQETLRLRMLILMRHVRIYNIYMCTKRKPGFIYQPIDLRIAEGMSKPLSLHSPWPMALPGDLRRTNERGMVKSW